jgi:branched-chain amino acid transport system permease protein
VDLASSAALLGLAYGLVGVAVSAPMLASRALHLAVGPVLVVGVVIGFLLSTLGVAAPIAFGVAVLSGALLSALLEPLVLRPLAARNVGDDDGDEIVRWLVGLAVAAALIEIAAGRWLVGRAVRPRPLLGLVEGSGLVVSALLGAAAILVLSVALAETRWGRRLRLLGGSRRAAELSGILPSRTRAGALAVSGAVAVVAGLVIAPVASIGTNQSAGLTIRGVAAAVVLGVGGPVRAVIAGLGLGVIEVASQWLMPGARSDVAIGLTVVTVLAIRGGELRRDWGRAW